MLKTNEIEPRHYRDAMARFAGAVHVVTTDGPAGKRGVTAIAACSVSDNPPTVLVCLNRENPNNDSFVKNGVFALNTLCARERFPKFCNDIGADRRVFCAIFALFAHRITKHHICNASA